MQFRSLLLRGLLPLLCLFALFVETAALTVTLIAERGMLLLTAALLLHSVASLICALLQIRFLPKVYTSEKRRILALLFAFDFIVPFLGMGIGWILLLWGFQKSQQIEIDKEVEDIDLQRLEEDFPVISRAFGEGSIPSLISSVHAPASKKIRALTLLTQMKSKASVTLIKRTLQDKNDEVRLVGFSMIDAMEKRINEKIHHLGNVARVHPDPMQRARAHSELAFTYWEQLYQGLVDRQLEQFVIDNIRKHIEAAKALILNDPKLYKLEGRILLMQKAFTDAKEAFLKAMEYGIPESEIASFMAQIAFEERNYSRIAYWMEKVPEQSINYQLHALRAVWVRESA
ncbi:MAG TPA: hypothetical protein ENK93_01750 [Campylobacteraceae bacterium]|nr:hypothetical protein [Campylobacteraceae bacterium]